MCYNINSSQIIAEKWENNLLIYIYDEAGSPIGLMYRNSTYASSVYDSFFFEKNLQGDVIAVYDSTGTKIGSYTYDAWGNFTTNERTFIKMKTITWNLKIDNRRYDVKYVSSQPYASGGLFVNGDKIANPQSKWYSFYKSEYTFSLNGKEITFLSYARDCDLIMDGTFVNHKTDAKTKARVDLFSWIGVLIGLCCLLIIPALNFQPLGFVISILFTAVNLLKAFSPFYNGWKKVLQNVIYTAAAFAAAYLAATL